MIAGQTGNKSNPRNQLFEPQEVLPYLKRVNKKR